VASKCDPEVPRLPSLTAFLLGDVGDRATAPITLCFWDCAKQYFVDPSRHTVAEHAHVRFRLSELREDTRASELLTLRIQVDPPPADLLPLVLVRAGRRWPYAAWIARQTAADSWDYGFNFSGGYPQDMEVYIYLIAR
jgi:hypothetical protein